MIAIRNDQEIECLIAAGHVVALTHQEIKKHIVAGITTREIDSICENFIRKQGATPSFKGLYGFPGSVCVSVNDVLVHGIPGDYVLKDGDIVTVDIGACINGYHGDSAWSYAVGNVSPLVAKLMKVTEESLYVGLKKATEGNRVTDISHAVQEYVESYGFSVPRDYTGHGVGREVHEDPAVPNFGLPGRGPKLKAGMCIAVEPMVQAGTMYTTAGEDGWNVRSSDGSLSAHYEHTVVITKGDCIITTKL